MRSDPAADPFTGRYLFHLHTAYTDGTPQVADYFDLARSQALDRLIFLEHIRRRPTYDVGRFVAEVRAEADRTGLPALVGFEAKVLPGGDLDISPEHASLADIIGIAEHGFPADSARWSSSLHRVLAGAAGAFGERQVVWVHPGLWLKRQGMWDTREAELRRLVSHAHSLGVRLEHNLRYGLLPSYLLAEAGPWVLGADAHSLADASAAVARLPAAPTS